MGLNIYTKQLSQLKVFEGKRALRTLRTFGISAEDDHV